MQNYNLCEIGTVKKEPTAFHKRVPLPTSLKDFIYYSGFLIQIYYRYHHYCYFDIFHWPGWLQLVWTLDLNSYQWVYLIKH